MRVSRMLVSFSMLVSGLRPDWKNGCAVVEMQLEMGPIGIGMIDYSLGRLRRFLGEVLAG